MMHEGHATYRGGGWVGSHTDRVTGHNDCLFPQNEDYKLTFISFGRKLCPTAQQEVASPVTTWYRRIWKQLLSYLLSWCPALYQASLGMRAHRHLWQLLRRKSALLRGSHERQSLQFHWSSPYCHRAYRQQINRVRFTVLACWLLLKNLRLRQKDSP